MCASGLKQQLTILTNFCGILVSYVIWLKVDQPVVGAFASCKFHVTVKQPAVTVTL
jgi:hypothetical protein